MDPFRDFVLVLKIANYEVGTVANDDRKEKEKTFFQGFPPVPGWYHCRIDGGEIDLYCKRCELTMKMRWIYPDGTTCEEPVVWTK